MVTRIRQLLEWQQLSPTQFADLIGVGRPVVSHILSERNKPSLEVVRHIKAAFPTVSLDWLVEGTGNMLAAAPASPVAADSPATVATPAQLPAPALASTVVASLSATTPLPPPATPAPAYMRQAASSLKEKPARFVKPAATTEAASPAISPVAAPAVGPPAPTSIPAAAEPTHIVFSATDDRPATALPMERPGADNTPQTVPPVPAAPPAAEAAALFGEPGKTIRRIVIFYRDGSFADYQPEG